MAIHGRISIVIVNYNTTAHLGPCLESILAHLDGGNIEVIVVDNNSPDRDIESFPGRFPGVRFHLRKENDGFGAGCNFGASRATGGFLLFMNPDVFLVDNSAVKLREYLEKYGDAGVVSGQMLSVDGKPLYFYNDFPAALWELFHVVGRGYDGKIRRLLARKELASGTPFEVDWFHGAFQMMRADDFKAVGGFNEEYFMYYEDTEMCYAMKHRLGKNNQCLPGVRYRHVTQSSVRDDSLDNVYAFHIQRGKLLFIRNYPPAQRLPVFVLGLTYVVSRILLLPVWRKYAGQKKEKLGQLLKTLNLYLDHGYLSSSKYEYIRR